MRVAARSCSGNATRAPAGGGRVQELLVVLEVVEVADQVRVGLREVVLGLLEAARLARDGGLRLAGEPRGASLTTGCR